MATRRRGAAERIESVISDRTWRGRQSWTRQMIAITTVTDRAHRVRLTVKCDAYDFQSYASAEVWTDDGWREIHRISGVELRSSVSYVNRDVQPSAFDGDLAELTRVTIAVLGGAS